MKTLLAIDLGTQTGWALNRGSVLSSGSQPFKPKRFEGGGMRYLRFSKWLDEMLILCDGCIDVVAFEEVRRHAGTDAAHVYGGLMATLTAWCESKDIPYYGIPVGTIKKFATGNGAAGKDMMIAAAREAGFDPVDDNEADAIHIHRLSSSEHLK